MISHRSVRTAAVVLGLAMQGPAQSEVRRHETRAQERLNMKRLVLALLWVAAAPFARAADSPDVTAVKAVLAAYKAGLEKLDVSTAAKLFAADSQVFESGGVEGTFADYVAHHIGPELAEFREFVFRDYKVEVRLESPLALATETYVYKIVFKAGDRLIEKRGVATSVLKKIGGEWKIVQTHTSSRNLPKKN